MDFLNRIAWAGIETGGGGVIIYMREDIPSKILTKHVLPTDIEALFMEFNFRKCKWLVEFITYLPHLNNISLTN